MGSKPKPDIQVHTELAPGGMIAVSMGFGKRNRWGGGEFTFRGQIEFTPTEWEHLREVFTIGSQEAGVKLTITDMQTPLDEDDRVFLEHRRYFQRLRKLLVHTRDIEVIGDDIGKLEAFRTRIMTAYGIIQPPDAQLSMRLHQGHSGLAVSYENDLAFVIKAPTDRALAALGRAIDECAQRQSQEHFSKH